MPAGFATFKVDPGGKLSEKLTPVRSTDAFGLVIVKLSTEVPLTGIEVGLNDFVTVGGLATVRVAEALLPVPPVVEVTLLVVLFLTPSVAAVTVTLKVQFPLCVTVA